MVNHPTEDVERRLPQSETDDDRTEQVERKRRRRLHVIAGVAVALLAVAALILMALPTRFEEDFQNRKELDALLTLVCFLVFGLAIIAVIPELFPDLRGSKTVIGLLLVVPLLAFLVLTDRISAISGAGVSLTVATVGETSLAVGSNPIAPNDFGTPVAGAAVCLGDQPAPYTVPSHEEAAAPIWTEFAPVSQQQAQGADAAPTPAPVATEVADRAALPARGPTNYWTLTLGLCTYDAGDLNDQLGGLIATGAFRFILLVDGTNRFVAYIPAGDAVFLFTEHADSFVTAVNDDRRDVLRGYTGIIFDTLTTEDTTLEAIASMREQNLDMLPVVDRGGIVQGVATWNQVLTSIILELATSIAA